MLIRVCDFCGKDMPDTEMYGIVTFSLANQKADKNYQPPFRYEICKDCYEEFCEKTYKDAVAKNNE